MIGFFSDILLKSCKIVEGQKFDDGVFVNTIETLKGIFEAFMWVSTVCFTFWFWRKIFPIILYYSKKWIL